MSCGDGCVEGNGAGMLLPGWLEPRLPLGGRGRRCGRSAVAMSLRARTISLKEGRPAGASSQQRSISARYPGAGSGPTYTHDPLSASEGRWLIPLALLNHVREGMRLSNSLGSVSVWVLASSS